jgi:adenylate cyclase
VIAIFGIAIKGTTDTANAMSALLDITVSLEKMDSDLSACVGITTGIVVAGNLDSSNRMSYSVMGDTVNLSARLESLTRLYSVTNIVSQASRDDAQNFGYLELDIVCVAGKSQSVRIFELLGFRCELSSAKISEVDAFSEVLEEYRLQNWDAAEEPFSWLQVKCDNTQLY